MGLEARELLTKEEKTKSAKITTSASVRKAESGPRNGILRVMDSSSSGQVTKAATLRSRTFCGAMLFVAGENLIDRMREH